MDRVIGAASCFAEPALADDGYEAKATKMMEENRSNSPSNSVFAIVGLRSTRYLTGWFLSCGVRRRRSLTGARQSEPHTITLKAFLVGGIQTSSVLNPSAE